MRSKIIIAFVLLLFFSGACRAATLYRVRFGQYPEKIRAVFDLDESFNYETEESKEKIVLRFKNVLASSEIENFVELNDLIVRHFLIERDGRDIKVTVPLSEPIEYNIFALNDPHRLVIDFGREYLNIVHGGSVAPGIDHLEVKKGVMDGPIRARVLRVDLGRAKVKPALARKKSSLVGSLINIFLPFTRADAKKEHFHLDQASNIISQNNGMAGVNGTFFATNGSPLGALMIDREVISSPIYDRTAFFLDENNQPYIDNVFISSSFLMNNQIRHKITGINQGRRDGDTIMYTPAWGGYTGTNSDGIEVVVSKSKISEINVSNSKIPEDGYVISVSGPQVEVFSESVKVGDPIDTSINVIPYAVSPKKIVNLISGGPRLLKNGRVYVSKHEEKFQLDIAKGRAARTAVGITRDGKLLLVTVDGNPRRKSLVNKEPASLGATLEELSGLMLSLGAEEAMNLDGGSSSTMVIKGACVNAPVAGSERMVSNAIVVQAVESSEK